jgi:3'-phosphoadenosine 5'-phosphosulfate (PAPS) 3'-phosphatase
MKMYIYYAIKEAGKARVHTRHCRQQQQQQQRQEEPRQPENR